MYNQNVTSMSQKCFRLAHGAAMGATPVGP